MEILDRVGHVARYLLGASVAGAVFMVESAIVVVPYAILATIGGGPLMGLLGLLLGFLIAFAIGLILIVTVVFPAILVGEVAARRNRWAVAAPVVVGMLFGLSTVVTVGLMFVDGATEMSSVILIYASLILPTLAFALTTYPAGWVTAKIWAKLRPLATRLTRRLKPDLASSADADADADAGVGVSTQR